jgi:drug/metabolite transporter (DMT)-like permease
MSHKEMRARARALTGDVSGASAVRKADAPALIPAVAIAGGWAVLAETPSWLAMTGGSLCLAGVFIARRLA